MQLLHTRPHARSGTVSYGHPQFNIKAATSAHRRIDGACCVHKATRKRSRRSTTTDLCGSDAQRRIAAAAIGSAIDDNWAPTDTADDRQCAIKSHSCPIVIVHRDWLSDHGGVHPVVPQMGDGRLVDVLMPPPISDVSGTCASDDGAEWAGGLAPPVGAYPPPSLSP
uniref:Uncharacterized protein n=1 Tax=Plectus sambesii TaxID=2011161 RepID=A0A914VZP3_9BILA